MTTRQLTPRGHERRRQLIDYAIVRFAENGYDPTSVAEIVAGIGVGKGVFYWYFESKEALLREILVESQNRLRRFQRDAIAGEPDPIRRIEIGVRSAMIWQAEHADVVALSRFAAGERRFAATLRQVHDIAVDDLIGHVKEAIVAGLIPDRDPQILARAVVGVTTSLTALMHRDDQPAEELAEIAVRFCLAGLNG